MKIFSGFDQYSLEWQSVRAGVITASEVDALVSPKWEVRKGKGVDTYCAQKAAEKWIQGPLPGIMTMDMELGSVLENEAIPWLSWEYGWELKRPPFISTDDAVCGCSPDALCNDGFGVEIKCPGPLNHVKYLLANEVPDDYKAQVQFSLWVTGFQKWVFVSYRRGFPNLVLSVKPDPDAQKAISSAVDAFRLRLNAAFDKLILLNGGTPPKANTYRERLLQPESELDVIP